MVDAATQYSPQKRGKAATAEHARPQSQHQARSELKEHQVTSKRRGDEADADSSSSAPSLAAVTSTSPQAPSRAGSLPIVPASDAAEDVPAQPAAPSNQLQPSEAKRRRSDAPAMKALPARYEDCDVKDLGIVIADMLMELIRTNDAIPLRDGGLTRFHSR
jgi:hypothetical protein